MGDPTVWILSQSQWHSLKLKLRNRVDAVKQEQEARKKQKDLRFGSSVTGCAGELLYPRSEPTYIELFACRGKQRFSLANRSKEVRRTSFVRIY
jgi:hypothetical protein